MFKLKYLIFLFITHGVCALTTLNVTLDTDNNPGGMGDVGDLRYYLNLMNQNLNSSIDDYAIVFNNPMTIQLNGILPLINNSSNPVNITIGNPGSTPTVTIDGNSTYNGFFIPTGNVTIQNMIFQNLTAKGGNGGDGISGGGGGMGAGAAIYAPQSFFNNPSPEVTLMNVSINNCAAIGGNGGNYLGSSSTGDEGGGGGGGFAGNGGSITTIGSCGGAGGGGFGGDGGDVTLSTDDLLGGGGGGGGGIGSRANSGTPSNLANGGSDQDIGQGGNGYGLANAGSGGGGNSGGNNAGGGGGGAATLAGGGGGGSSNGGFGNQPQGNIPPGGSAEPSGGNGADGGGGGGGGVVTNSFTNAIDGQAGSGGYGGGGGGGAGTGSYDAGYMVQGGAGGIGGGGGGGGVNQSGSTLANGGSSQGGGGGAGGGPTNSSSSPAQGGTDQGNLGGGSGGAGANNFGAGFGGGGGGGGSGLGGAIFVDSNVNFTIQAISGIPTIFNTTYAGQVTQAGAGGSGGSGGGAAGTAGSALGDSIFLRSGSTLTFLAQDIGDLLTLGDQVAFTDDTSFGVGGANVFVKGNGTIIYNGTTDYAGTITIDNANFKVNGQIDTASVSVCRNSSFSAQRGTLSGSGTLTGGVFVNSGTISPDTDETLTLGSLILNAADPIDGTLGSLVHIEIDSSNTSLVAINGAATLAGILEMDVDSNAQPGTYTILSSSGITGTFDSIIFTGATPHYTLSYLPAGSPTFVQFDFLGFGPLPPTDLIGFQQQNDFGTVYELFNTLQWQPSPSMGVLGYYIYRDSILIATVSASTTSYQDHDQPRGVASVYGVAAFDANGTSDQATVTVG